MPCCNNCNARSSIRREESISKASASSENGESTANTCRIKKRKSLSRKAGAWTLIHSRILWGLSAVCRGAPEPRSAVLQEPLRFIYSFALQLHELFNDQIEIPS